MDMAAVAAFLAVDLLLVFTPGADWAYAIAAGLRGRSVVPAVAGLVAGYAGYTLLAVAGLVVVVAGSPAALTVLTVVGAGYLIWLGLGVLGQPVALAASTEPDAMAAGTESVALAASTEPVAMAAGTQPGALAAGTESVAGPPWRIALKGAGISGLNPKALLLYFSLFPQFIDAGAGWPVAAQTGLLGALHMAACAVVYLAVGVLARTVLRTRPSTARAVTRVPGALMIVIGGFLLVERLAG